LLALELLELLELAGASRVMTIVRVTEVPSCAVIFT